MTDCAMLLQAARPFSVQTLAYISRLDADADLALLESNGLHLRPECQRIFKVGCLAVHVPAHHACRMLNVVCGHGQPAKID